VLPIRTTASVCLVLVSQVALPSARAGTTREQVRAEYEAARRAGDVLAPGESGLTLRELHPENYPAPRAATKSRAAEVAEVQEARSTGDLLAPRLAATTPPQAAH
jgi:hypothetical protein